MKTYITLLVFIFSISSSGFGQSLVINEIMTSNSQTISDQDGDYVDWIELYNNSSSSIDLANFKLSDDPENLDKWTFPSVTIGAYDFLIIYASGKDRPIASELHTNFKVKSDGEALVLSDPSNTIVDSYPPISLGTDRTYGRLDDGTQNFGFLSNPTPDQSNNSEEFITEILFSNPSGFYNSSFDLVLTCEDSIYYTLDGSEPSMNSTLYTEPIPVSAAAPNKLSLIPTTPRPYAPNVFPNNELGFQTPRRNLNKGLVLRALAFKNGNPTSKVYSHTYFTENIEYKFPVISLITDSFSLFDHDTGIYVPGIHLDSSDIDWTGNYHQRGDAWERMGNVELFNSSGNLEFSEAIGFRISGRKSRTAPQKSIRLYFRDEYGASKIDYSFFPSRTYSDFKRILLRSSFTYWWGKNTLFQDDLIQRVVSQNEIDLDIQMSHPSVLFINGEYWGIHNIRERQDKHYLESLHGVDGDSVDIIEGNTSVIEGSADDFIELLEFVELNDLSNPANYEYVKTKIDIDNYMNYLIVEMFFDNQDWPWNNVKLWKPQRPNSKWRWLLYDLDATASDYTRNPFEAISKATDKQSTLFNNLLKNSDFSSLFLDRFIAHLQTTFNPNQMTKTLDQFQSIYAPEVSEHIERWSNPADYSAWTSSCDFLSSFIENRPCYMKSILIDQFNLSGIPEYDCLYGAQEQNITIFPNPSAGLFTISIDTENDGQGSIAVFNELGIAIYSKTIYYKTTQADLSFLNNGIYFLRVDFNGFQELKKIVIYKS